MRRSVISFLGGTALVLSTSSAVLAHHAFAAEYNWKKPVTITGSVTKVDWANPHTLVYVDGKDESGNAAMWKLELGGPSALTKHGWTRTTLKQGEQVTVDGWLAKDGSKSASAKSVKLANGKELFAASSFYDNMPVSRQARR
jgi:Family of unknown function (DUF6152)